ncbi:MAG: sigma-70 family RNA polymerase sigma factor [Planctomycetales bacterium]|nr:sigma-70 family RNA polymerase sigma factor [Planctomycetales bacterium]
MADTEDTLERRIRAGDREAVAEYVESRRAQLRVYVDRNMSAALRQKVDADDLIQEVMLSCVSSVDQIDLVNRDLFGWICQVAQRRIVDAGRKFTGAQKRDAKREVSANAGGSGDEQQGLINLLVASITSPSRAFSRNQREFRLLAAMDQLAEESRDALRMRYVESLPTKEIAKRIGKTDGAVRVMLTRSLKKLGDLLKDSEEDPPN